MNYERELCSKAAKYITRRWFFRQCSVGLDSIALGSMLGAERVAGASATLAAVGFDHEKLTFRFQGRDYRLTDVHGELVEKVLA